MRKYPALRFLLCLGLSFSPCVLPLSAVAQTQSEQSPTHEALRVVILPFENITQNPDDAWLSRSFSESLTMGLLRVEQLQLIERAQLQNVMKEQHLGQSVYADESKAPRLGKLVGAKWVVLGSFQKVGEQLQANVRVVDVETGQIERARSAQVEGSLERIFQLQKQLAHQLVEQLNVQPEDRDIQDMDKVLESTQSLQAYRYYMEGKEALQSLDARHRKEAIRAFRKALIEDENYALAYVGLAEAYVMQVQQQAQMMVPPPEAGQALMRMSDPLQEARAFMDKALALDPNSPDVWRMMAVLAGAEGNGEQAMEWVRKAIALDPDNGAAVLTWVELRQQQSKTSFSIDTLRSELRQMGAKMDDPWLKFYLASNGFALEALRPNGDLKWVKQLIDEAAQALPDYPYIPIIQSGVALFHQKPDRARQYLERAYATGQNYPQVLITISEMYANLKNYERALQLVAEAEKLGVNEDDAQLARADIFFAQGQREQAESLYADLMRRHPKSTTIFFTRGMHYFSGKDPEDFRTAKASLQRALENHDAHGSVLNRTMIASLLAAAAYVTEDYALSQKLYEELRADPLYYGVAYDRLASIYQKQNKLDEAFESFQNYLTIHAEAQSKPHVQQRYRELYLLRERANKGDSSAILNDLAQIYILEKRWDEAAELLDKALSLDPQNPVVYFNRAVLAQHRDTLQAAARDLEQAVALKGDYVKAWYSLGLVHSSLNNTRDAAVALRRVLELDPQHAGAREALLKLRD